MAEVQVRSAQRETCLRHLVDSCVVEEGLEGDVAMTTQDSYSVVLSKLIWVYIRAAYWLCLVWWSSPEFTAECLHNWTLVNSELCQQHRVYLINQIFQSMINFYYMKQNSPSHFCIRISCRFLVVFCSLDVTHKFFMLLLSLFPKLVKYNLHYREITMLGKVDK